MYLRFKSKKAIDFGIDIISVGNLSVGSSVPNSVVTGLGGLATAAAPLIGGAAVLGAGAYGLKKLNDKKTREGTIGSSFDESTGEYIPGPEEMNPEFYKNKKITPISKDINVNKMSSDLAAQKESMPAANTVIAPSTSSVVSNNISQTMSMLPNNPDRSFINLNSIPI